MQTPKAAHYQMSAEWQLHDAVWLAWPCDSDLWKEKLEIAQSEFITFCEAIADINPVSGRAQGEKLNILVQTPEMGAQVEKALGHLSIGIYTISYGDIWLRDTGPIFLKNDVGEVACVRYLFNGWGGKYNLDHDPEVAEKIAKASHKREFIFREVLEGGSIEVDGEGTCLTSRQCLLNPNRNPALNQEGVEKFLQESLGVRKILWLGEGLVNDHTDGHIDTMARFSAPQTVLCMEARTPDDPNAERFKIIQRDLESMTDACGRRLTVRHICSPGKILSEESTIMPASYLNFYIANTTVIVPTYGSPFDKEAVSEIAKSFPGRRTIGLSAKAILSGGGAFHCMSQQQPSPGERAS